MTEQTIIFLTGYPVKSSTGISDPVFAVFAYKPKGVTWHKHIMPNLKRALVELNGNKTFREQPYVWPIDTGNYSWGYAGTKKDVFDHWHKHKMHTRIILYEDGSHKIYKPGT